MKTIQIRDTHIVIAHITSFDLRSAPLNTLSRKRPKPRTQVLSIGLTSGETIAVKGDQAAEIFKEVAALFA